MYRALTALLTLIATGFAGCGGGSSVKPTAHTEQSYSSDRASRVLDWGDIEAHRGELVTVEGTFRQIRGEHGIVTLDSGLDVYLPNIHLFLRGQPWYDYVRKRVSVQGILRTEGCDIPGYKGPSLQSVSSFAVVSQ